MAESKKKSKKKAQKKPESSAKKASPAKKKSATKKRSLVSTLASSGRSSKKKSSGGSLGMDFIGTFPLRKKNDDKKNDLKKAPTGPVFDKGEYVIGYRKTDLSERLAADFKEAFNAKHSKDGLREELIAASVDNGETSLSITPPSTHKAQICRETFNALAEKRVDLVLHNMKELPLRLPDGLILAASIGRVDPRDAMVTKSTYGAIQELPRKASIGANSRRRVMQIKAVRPDLNIIEFRGSTLERIEAMEANKFDAVLVAWASLKRLNHSPRFYVALQSEQMLPAPCQGIIGVVCRTEDRALIEKLRYIEDSEASWASRCERAFLAKFGEFGDPPLGAVAHRKGTQDPWILDICIGDHKNGDILKHREIGTSRCKPESLADKAFTGVLSKGGRKFFPFH